MNFNKRIISAVVLSVPIAILMGCGGSYMGSSGPTGTRGRVMNGYATGNTAQGSVSFQLFYDELNPYGNWVEYKNYGYAWIPNVEPEFSPYTTDGHWVYTDDGWTWVSDYSWGWAPFHYGRWDYDNYYGWLWVPGNEWGPAWVTWRRSEGYYGWAPMGPGISIDVSFGSGYRVPDERWTFVSDTYLGRPDIDRHYVDRSTNVTIVNNSTVINNTYIDNSRHITYVAGPGREDVQKVTGAAIRPVAIRENDRPGQALSNDQLRIYRPQVQTGSTNDRKPVPEKLVNLREVKPVSERRQGNQRRDENLPANVNEQPSQPPKVNIPDTTPPGERPPRINIPPDSKMIIPEPSPPPNVNPPGDTSSGVQPRIFNPNQRTRDIGKPPQPPTGNPSEIRERGQQPRFVLPPDNKKILEGPPETQPLNPADDKRKGQRPPVFNKPENNKGIQEPPETQTLNPADEKRKGQRPPVFNQPENNKNIQEPPETQPLDPANDKRNGQQPPVLNLPEEKNTREQQLEIQNARPADDKGRRLQPRIVAPPDTGKNIFQQPRLNNVRPPTKRGKSREIQPQKPTKQEQDSVKNHSQFYPR
ncbi:MAG TPA: DUF6600 domain-containing protein [Bacteroidota bacterium]|nr:DUF6600 domain-containing protein [Bacteroidota bacterium]